MLDIKFIRENPELVKENIKKKFQDEKLPMVDEVIALDEKRRANIQEADQLRADRNRLSKQVGMLMGQAKKDPSKLAEAEAVKKQVTDEAERLAALEKLEAELDEKVHHIMLQIPQIIDPSVPIGPDDSANVEVQRFGDPRCPTSPSPTTPTSWRALTVSIWTPQAAYPAPASIICWVTSPACTRPCWPMAGTS